MQEVQRTADTQAEHPVGQIIEVPEELTVVAILVTALAIQALELSRE